MTARTKLTLGGVLAALIVVVFSVGVVVARTPAPSPQRPSGAPPTHEQMHLEGTSERMHEAMGEDAEALMEQCAAMMAMMTH